MYSMRRSDREITDPAIIDGIIRSADCCRLGFNDAGEVYILPLNFGYEHTGDERVFYFHGAGEGRKIELVKRSPRVGFELDTNHELLPTDGVPCGYSFRYSSVIGNGVMSIVEDESEKARALNVVMEHYTGRGDYEFPEGALRAITVLRLDVEKLSCKARA